MKRSDAFPSRYVNKDDVQTPVMATIDTVRFDTIQGRSGGEDEDKPVVYFRDNVKPMILNNTNWTTLEDTYGPESDDWTGKTIELYCDPGVMYGGKRMGGVRIRIPNGHKTMTLEQANATSFVTKSGDMMTIGQLDMTKLDLILNTPSLERLHEPAQIRKEALANAVEL
jgi:hypothetical protein